MPLPRGVTRHPPSVVPPGDPDPVAEPVPDRPPATPPHTATGRRAGAALVALVLAVLVAWLVSRSGGGGAGDLGYGEAVLLGLVEGVTEWLPISSTGHLTVTQDLLGIRGEAADSYIVVIQAGAILAVLGLYHERFATMLRGLRGHDPVGRRTLGAVLVACLPAAVVGLLLEDTIKERLFGPWPVVAAWCAGGVAILATAGRRPGRPQGSGITLSTLGWRTAGVIGLAQTLALWPGVSRSLVTILAATAAGLTLPAAVEFSFLVGFVILGGATLHELTTSGPEILAAYSLGVPLAGLVVAFVAAVAGMRWMVGYLDTHSFAVFGWYRLAAGATVAVLLVTHVL